ncbi:hypothetical protein [Amycolatopsis sp. FDAARGOS 1241]|uniref:hypothetical protein n=1 Tax=Amycolatopsis sp. FDAARGOS 1241 TaxID=2778070 RepID=UPI00194DDF43|nr:hypothetical protein [Amycolatopsis sp. FDAARGOS 1241]QRP47353.1 hypothetical protein I6J71_05045 [Amycolatopsis sp. FDAARGOS 1241]
MRPIAVLEVDGVLALDDPCVPVVETVVHTCGHRWARPIKIPVGAADVLHRLAAEFDVVWASSWSHNAHPALQEALDLPTEPWPFLPVQFRKLTAIRTHAAGRPWAWIDDAIHDLGPIPEPKDGLLVPVDPRVGIMAVDPVALREEVFERVTTRLS